VEVPKSSNPTHTIQTVISKHNFLTILIEMDVRGRRERRRSRRERRGKTGLEEAELEEKQFIS
jgi:hypothetical protein